ncbi:FtsQ-type POTRA domain-containing protein [Modestobacter sp. NPDC049651]|uniref:cell division protein FtsQ/DivIB n=1 Tax=unclassified Modestobacter TaxID=2643866 RepID=UPI0033CD8A81
MSRPGRTTSDRARATRRGASPDDPAVTPLRARRRSRQQERRRRLLTGAAVVVVAAGLVAWVVLGSSLLAVRTVRVDGVTALPADQVARASGIRTGTPLVRVDTAAAAARVRELPQVAGVAVDRGWPHTVVVTVTERVPVAVVVAGDRRELVDRDGIVFDTVTGDPPAGVVPLDVARPGPDDPATRAALAAVTALPREVRAQVTGVVAHTPDDVTLTLTDGRSVLWGSADRTARKAQVLSALLARIEAGDLDPAATLDVSTPDSVVLR